MTEVEQVLRCIEEVFRNKGVDPPTLLAETSLDASLGLDSLDYAELVVRLEAVFGFDPFARGSAGEIRTAADLASLYQSGSPSS